MKYSDHTRNTTESLKKVAHGTRLQEAAKMIVIEESQNILDFGCGDGHFFYHLEQYTSKERLFGYDPSLLSELEFEGATTYDDVEELRKNHKEFFDVVYCMEVCEHLNDVALYELFAHLRYLSKDNAVIVFGLPIETGFSGFFKNIYRTLKGNRQGATFSLAFQSLLSIATDRVSSDTGWIGSHIGFDIKSFTKRLDYGGFVEVDAEYLPWPKLGRYFNNEKYYICKRNERKFDGSDATKSVNSDVA